MSPNSIGRISHRGPADDPQRVGLLEAHLAQLVLTDVLDVPTGASSRSRPARSIADAQPFSVEHVRVTVGHRHQLLSGSRRSRFPPRVYRTRRVPVQSCQRRGGNTIAARLLTLRMASSQHPVRSVGCPRPTIGSRVAARNGPGSARPRWPRCWRDLADYLNQIGNDVRPLTVAVLLRITEVFRGGRDVLSGRHPAGCRTQGGDPGPRSQTSPSTRMMAEMVSTHPGLACGGHRRWFTTAQLAAATYSDGSGRVDHHAARKRCCLLPTPNYLHAALDTAARSLTAQFADAPRRPGPRIDPPAHRGARVRINKRYRPRADTVLRRYDRDQRLDQPIPLPEVAGVQDGRRLAISSSATSSGAMVTDSKFTSAGRGRWPGWAWLITSPRPPCCFCQFPRRRHFRYDVRRSSSVLLGELRDHRPPAVN